MNTLKKRGKLFKTEDAAIPKIKYFLLRQLSWLLSVRGKMIHHKLLPFSLSLPPSLFSPPLKYVNCLLFKSLSQNNQDLSY